MERTPLKERMIKAGRYRDWEEACNDFEKPNLLNTFTVVPKQMSVEQLQQGLYWLLGQFYTFSNFTERFKAFFENFENSPKKDKIKFQKSAVDLEGLAYVYRLIKYLLFKSSQKDRRFFWDLLRHARRSSHPQRIQLLIGSFLGAKHLSEMMTNLPAQMQNKYPQASPKTAETALKRAGNEV